MAGNMSSAVTEAVETEIGKMSELETKEEKQITQKDFYALYLSHKVLTEKITEALANNQCQMIKQEIEKGENREPTYLDEDYARQKRELAKLDEDYVPLNPKNPIANTETNRPNYLGLNEGKTPNNCPPESNSLIYPTDAESKRREKLAVLQRKVAVLRRRLKEKITSSQSHQVIQRELKAAIAEETKAEREYQALQKESYELYFPKGNYGEMLTDVYMYEIAYEKSITKNEKLNKEKAIAIHTPRILGFYDKGHQGIDGIYVSEDGATVYIVDAKYGTAELGEFNYYSVKGFEEIITKETKKRRMLKYENLFPKTFNNLDAYKDLQNAVSSGNNNYLVSWTEEIITEGTKKRRMSRIKQLPTMTPTDKNALNALKNATQENGPFYKVGTGRGTEYYRVKPENANVKFKAVRIMKQMSPNWIDDRLEKALGEEGKNSQKACTIKIRDMIKKDKEHVKYRLVNVLYNGNVIEKEITHTGDYECEVEENPCHTANYSNNQWGEMLRKESTP